MHQRLSDTFEYLWGQWNKNIRKSECRKSIGLDFRFIFFYYDFPCLFVIILRSLNKIWWNTTPKLNELIYFRWLFVFAFLDKMVLFNKTTWLLFQKNNSKCSHLLCHQNRDLQFKDILISCKSKSSEQFLWLVMQTADAKSVEDKWWNFVNRRFFINFNGIKPPTIKATLNCTNFIKSIAVMCTARTFIPSFRVIHTNAAKWRPWILSHDRRSGGWIQTK